MATLTPSSIVPPGLAEPSLGAAAGGGDQFSNPTDERTFLIVNNGGGGSIDVTVSAQKSPGRRPGFGALTLADRVVAVGAGAQTWIGPFPDGFNDANGNVQVAYSGVTSVTVAAVRLPLA